ncbi:MULTISPECIES: hypothetical protein [Maribacter]|uniref:NnrS family protein n=2 Tax=Maribacter TaxID=252356 RepID=A0A5R8M9L6_9FLAO|nr:MULTISPECIES: hypothetical protein [Maribacter]KAA2219027.1 hypothetical protein F0361_05285 [Maribacter flavus]TLF46253.1 hypothetical protein FEK29_00295 [Maribacter aurantiacus]
MEPLRKHIAGAGVYFLLAALLGGVLRLFPVIEIPVNYKYFVHTHSHIALLGWVYLALTTLIYKLFIQSPLNERKYRKIFWFTQFTLAGMLFSFPFQGYALFSIIFSTLFLFASYAFLWLFESSSKKTIKQRYSFTCLRWALWYMILSSIGPWALGAIMNTMGNGSIWYRLAIYFYLHFQYNGWMILALLGLYIYLLEENKITVPKKKFKDFFRYFNIGIILSFFLSALWTHPPIAFYILGGIGAFLQLFGFFALLSFGRIHQIEKVFSKPQWNLMKTVLCLFLIKIVLQLLTSFPYFANLAATILDFTIGYLHWTFLGVITIAIFLFLDYFKLMQIDRAIFKLYFLAFLATEILIIYKGIAAWQGISIFRHYLLVLAVASLLFAVTIALLLFRNIKKPLTHRKAGKPST